MHVAADKLRHGAGKFNFESRSAGQNFNRAAAIQARLKYYVINVIINKTTVYYKLPVL